MKRIATRLMILAAVFVLLPNIQAWAAVITATSCSQAHVQAAIDKAQDGDTVIIPQGTCTWSNSPGAPYGYQSVCVNKPLSLLGSGEGVTVIVDDTDNSYSVNPLGIKYTSVSDTTARISGFTMRYSTRTHNATGEAIDVSISGSGKHRVRVDHMTFDSIGRVIMASVNVHGVIDHVNVISGEILLVSGEDWDGEWMKPLNMGSEEAWYIEDSSFTYPGWADGTTDCRNGGKYVFRYNTVSIPLGSGFSGLLTGNHGYDSASRSGMSLEAYGNMYINNDPAKYLSAFQFRGGTGVVFNNVIMGPHWTPISITNYRSCTGYLGNAKGMCDGTVAADGNLDHGWPCRDQIGRSGGMAGGLQTSDPLYQWNNTVDSGSTVYIRTYNGSTGDCGFMDLYHIKAGRDYFDGTPRPGYVPYPYPHPLSVQGESGRLLNLRKISIGNQVNLNWDAISGATGYGVSRDWGVVIPVFNSTYQDNNPVQVYIVYAYDSGGKIIAAEGVNTDDQAPSVPTNLRASAVTSYSVTLAWDESIDNFGVIGYRVYQGTNTASVANVSGVTTATIFNLNPLTQYSFTVAAYDAGGNESAKSGPVSVTTSAGFTISGQVTLNGAGLVNVVMSGLPTLIFTKANGDYTATVDQGWSGTITPTLSGYTFTPPSIDYSSGVTANQVDQNYTATASGGGGGGGGGDSGGGGGGGGCFIAMTSLAPAQWIGLPVMLLFFLSIGLVGCSFGKRKTLQSIGYKRIMTPFIPIRHFEESSELEIVRFLKI